MLVWNGAPLNHSFYFTFRSELSKKAEKESISIFCSNVKSLLLTPPVRGKTVIGIDPGFYHGCKIAVISSKGTTVSTVFTN